MCGVVCGVVWCGVVVLCGVVVCGVMTTLRQAEGIKLTRFPRTCYLAESHEFTLSAWSGRVTVTLRSNILIDFSQNINRRQDAANISSGVR